MVHRLYLLRHAKSSWDHPGLEDHERPLAPRGRRDLKRIEAYVKKAGIEPSVVLCSTSVRTRETLARIRPALGGKAKIHFEADLYGAADDELLARLRDIPENLASVLVIGHNPGLHDLALRLVKRADLERLQGKFPTGAFVTFELTCAWAHLADHVARLSAFVLPRELA